MRTDKREKDLESDFFNAVRAVGGIATKIFPVTAGPPDRFVIMPVGQIFLVELKREGEVPRRIQRHWHHRAELRGVPVYIVTGTAGIKRWVAAAARGELGPGADREW